MMTDADIESKIERKDSDLRTFVDDGKSIGSGLAVIGYCLLLGCKVIARAIAYGSVREDNEVR